MAKPSLDISVRRKIGSLDLELDFSASTGGLTAVFGRSGSGKTTLINMLAGLLKPDAGRISLYGKVVFDSDAGIDLPPDRRNIGYVFQEGRLFPHMKVKTNLLYGVKGGLRSEQKIVLDEVVELLGIGKLLDRRPHHLSGGEKQRVAIGRALLMNPDLLIMDEPLAALDDMRKHEILPFIERVRDEIVTPIVYVTHSVAEIHRLASSVIVMREGRLLASGSVAEVERYLSLSERMQEMQREQKSA